MKGRKTLGISRALLFHCRVDSRVQTWRLPGHTHCPFSNHRLASWSPRWGLGFRKTQNPTENSLNIGQKPGRNVTQHRISPFVHSDEAFICGLATNWFQNKSRCDTPEGCYRKCIRQLQHQLQHEEMSRPCLPIAGAAIVERELR